MDQALLPEQKIVAALRKIVRAVDLHSRHLMDAAGMTGPQLATLQEIARLGPASAGAIARAVYLSQGTVTGILARLENRGLIARHRSDSDRRSTVITVTTEGKRLLESAPSLLQDRFREQLGQLQEWEQHLILSTLQRVATLMGAEDIDAAPHLDSHTDSLLDDEPPAPDMSAHLP